MEYIIVQIKDKPNVDTNVLINRQPNGARSSREVEVEM